MGDETSPNIKLAAETDPADLEKDQARRELGWEIREMTANLLRVMRGAGRPHELPQQIINLSGSILEVHEKARAWAIWSAMEDVLQDAVPRWYEDKTSEHAAHIGDIAKGSLQFLASRLLHQIPQIAAGEREMLEGIRSLEQYHERQREKYRQLEAEMLAKIKPRAVKRKARKKVTPKKPVAVAPPAPKPLQPEKETKPNSTADFMRRRRQEMRSDD